MRAPASLVVGLVGFEVFFSDETRTDVFSDQAQALRRSLRVGGFVVFGVFTDRPSAHLRFSETAGIGDLAGTSIQI